MASLVRSLPRLKYCETGSDNGRLAIDFADGDK